MDEGQVSASTPALTTHLCPGGCGEQIAYTRLSCLADWIRLPEPIRNDINVTYRKRRSGPLEHLAAIRAAVDWYKTNPNDESEPHHAP